jgi:hypothetical protein
MFGPIRALVARQLSPSENQEGTIAPLSSAALAVFKIPREAQ